MQQKTHSRQFIRHRKLLMILPLMILPLLTLMFWILGGGKVNHADPQQPPPGLNIQLPGAHLPDDRPFDKLSYYEMAASDSLKLQQLIENDPYYGRHLDTPSYGPEVKDTFKLGIKYGDNVTTTRSTSYINSYSTSSDPNERKVYQKLAQLDSALKTVSPAAVKPEVNIQSVEPVNNTTVNSSDIDRLEQMMQVMNQKGGDDPEMQQLDSMLEKILDIQHPDRLRDKIKQTSEVTKGQVFAVDVNKERNSISLMDNRSTKTYGANIQSNSFPQLNRFYSIEDGAPWNESQNSIQAVIHGTQTVVNGSTVKLRLMNDVLINDIFIPKDNFVFGTADINGERLGIKINSIRYHNSIFPVDLSVCDMDGMDGIYIPGAITRDVAKQTGDRAAQQIDFTTFNPSIGAQAANAGIQASKTLFSKKATLIKVTVKAGYQVLLRDGKQRQNN